MKNSVTKPGVSMRVIVISDLHIGAGPLEDFDPEVEQALVEFCRQVVADMQPTELVINGDFLDFVQAEPWQSAEFEAASETGVPLCFTEEQSLGKLASILGAHASTFDALAELLKSKDIRRVTILPGNHDADLFWPQVQTRFRARLAGPDAEAAKKVHFHLELQYQPVEFPQLWIEHGHQRDLCNVFDINGVPCWSVQRPPILKDANNTKRLVECVGTRFLLKFLNDMDEKYPFVDNVKPFSKFVKMFLVSGAARDFGPIKALVSYWALVSFIGNRQLKSPKDLLGVEEAPPKMAAEMRRLIGELSDARSEKLKARLVKDGFALIVNGGDKLGQMAA